MPTTTTPQTPPGVGTTLIRLANIPLADRLKAIHTLMANQPLSPEDAQTMLALALDPGDASGRIA